MKKKLLVGSALPAAMLCVLFPSGSAFAQEPAGAENSDEGGIGEIVVTAQKRAENVQNVPIAISAFGGEALSERAVSNVSQLASLSPNVNLDSGVSFTASTAVLAASIRGIGASDFAFNIDPAVGVYVDGVYLARSVGANQDLLDVERIEILKGPQGTLFGRNTIGGAVSIVTRDPGKEFGVRGDVTVGRFNLFQGRASIDLPLAQNLTSSITVDVKTRNGYMKRLPFPSGSLAANSPPYTVYPAAGYESPSQEGDEDNRTIRGKIKYDGGNFRLTISGDYAYTKGTAPTKLLQTTNGDPGGLFGNLYNLCISTSVADLTAIGLINMCNSSGTQLPSRHRAETFPVNRLYTLAGVNVDANPNNNLLPWDNRFITNSLDTTYATGNNFSRLKNWGFTGIAEVGLGDHAMLKSITSFRKSHWVSGLDGDGSPVNMSTYSFDQQQKQFSEELQLVGSALDDKLHYVLGAYYFNESGYLADYVISGEGIYVIDGPNWLDTNAYAAFGQLDYRFSDVIGITVGGRYTHESKSFEGGQQELSGLFYKLAGAPCSDLAGNVFPNALLGAVSCRVANNYPDPNNPLRIYPGGINHLSFNNFSPKVGIQIHPSQDVMIYGSWSKGYKTGGWTTRYSTPQTFVSSFDPEKATTYEVGLKSTLLNRRLQINAALFYTDYNAIQLNYQVGGSPTIANVGDGKIKGAELEIVAQPTRGLTLNFALGYTDAYYTRLDPAVAVTSGPSALQAGALVGSVLPKTPSWKINFSPKYEFQLGNGGRVTLLGDYTYISEQTNNVERTFVLNRPGVSILNASISYADPGEHYTLTVGGTNLTNERYVTSGSAIPAFGAIVGSYNRPVEWYARLGFKF